MIVRGGWFVWLDFFVVIVVVIIVVVTVGVPVGVTADRVVSVVAGLR